MVDEIRNGSPKEEGLKRVGVENKRKGGMIL